MEYLFDTNIFVESKKNLPMDVWPTFWTKMVELINSGNIHSIDKVKDEIDKGGDELTDWIHNNAPRGFFLTQDVAVMAKLAETITWAQNCTVRFSQSAIFDYTNVADSYLVATAAARNMVLVTYEKSNPQRRNRVMLPDACYAIGVRSCDLNTALRELGVLI
ncbi:MAG: DUF4411 family protein [Prevotellaceae bacterium]|nr:DUF4411 family protein [Prevotella sp.]MDD7606576.1 DUF4411 family protein [Prevotellaceae bacterium]